MDKEEEPVVDEFTLYGITEKKARKILEYARALNGGAVEATMSYKA